LKNQINLYYVIQCSTEELTGREHGATPQAATGMSFANAGADRQGMAERDLELYFRLKNQKATSEGRLKLK